MGINTSNINTNLEANQNEDIKEALGILQDFSEWFHRTISVGVELHDLNIPNELSNTIERAINSPIESSYVAYLNLRNSIVQLINDSFTHFLATRTHLLDAAFRVSENNLHYAIVLKDDSIDSEAELLSFKMEYDQQAVSKSFPLIISFPTFEELENAKIAGEINFEQSESES